MPTPSQSGGSKGSKAPNVHSKLRKLGLLDRCCSGKSKQLTFKLFFPRPPYRGAQYKAARGKDALYNFVGLVLGHGGTTVQRIQKISGAKIEVCDSAGNLNGAHPSSHGDPSLHAWVSATSWQRLDKAVALLLEVMQPTNTRLRGVQVEPGAFMVLEPVIPSDWPEAGEVEPAVAEDEADAALPSPRSPPPPPPPPATNAWTTNRLLLKPQPDDRQMSPTSSLHRSQGAAAVAESNTSSDADEPELEAAAPRTPGKVPLPRSPTAVPAARLPAPASAAATAAQPPSPPPLSAASALQQLQAQAQPLSPTQQQQMATVWAKSLHHLDSMESPTTPSAPVERGPGHELYGSTSLASSSLSWSLWDQRGSGSTFYEHLQAAASGNLHTNSSGAASAAPGSMLLAHLAAPPPPPGPALPPVQAQAHYMVLPTVMPVAAPFPGLDLAPQGLGLGLGFPHASHASLARCSSSDAEHEMQQLLAAVASMATLEV